jgi:hypothetical protein
LTSIGALIGKSNTPRQNICDFCAILLRCVDAEDGCEPDETTLDRVVEFGARIITRISLFDGLADRQRYP